LAVALKAGLDGIRSKIQPPAPINRNIFDMTDSEREKECIPCLPGTLYEALEALKNDKLIREALGEHSYSRYVEAKRIEWNEYKMQISQWELEKYLNKF
jgi:glutamine synthetase